MSNPRGPQRYQGQSPERPQRAEGASHLAVPNAPPLPLSGGLGILAMATLLILLPSGCGSDGAEGITEPTPVPSLSLSLTPSALEVEAGGATTVTATVARGGGFSGSVDLEVGRVGDHLAVEVGEWEEVGSALRFPVRLTVDPDAPGDHRTLSLRAHGTGGLEAAAELEVTLVEAPEEPGPEVILDLSACRAGDTPIWLAVWNGRDGWQRAQAEGNRVTFNLARDHSVGGFAWVTAGAGRVVSVQLATQEELTAFPQPLCTPVGTGMATATVAGLDETHAATFFLGGGRGSAQSALPDARINGIMEGVHDLLAYRGSLIEPGCADRILIRRDVEVESGGSLGVVDFQGDEAFAPATARATLSGAGSGQKIHLMGYYSGDSCVGGEMALHPARLVEGSSFTIRGVPASHQRSSDMHQLTVTEVDGPVARLAAHFFRELSDQAVELWPGFTPHMSDTDGAHRRLAMETQIPSPYLTGETGVVSLTFGTGDLTFTTSASFAALGGSEDMTLVTADLSAVEGWDATWAPAPGATVQWTVQVTAVSTLEAARRSFCGQEAWVRMAGVSGTR